MKCEKLTLPVDNPCVFGDRQFIYDVPGHPDIHVNILFLNDFPEAVNICPSESYAGSVIGNGYAWEDEISFCFLLAMGRAMEFDYQLGIDCPD